LLDSLLQEKMQRPMLSAYTLAMLALSASAASTSQQLEDELPMVQTAMEFLARASTTSEVLTLNLTNLLILLALKALIFGFGLFSSGGAAGLGGIGRSIEDNDVDSWMSPAEITGGMCFMMYTAGAEDKLDCIQRTGCEAPEKMKDYLVGGDLWYQMHKYFGSMVPFDEKYQRLYHKLAEGVEDGFENIQCSSKYSW